MQAYKPIYMICNDQGQNDIWKSPWWPFCFSLTIYIFNISIQFAIQFAMCLFEVHMLYLCTVHFSSCTMYSVQLEDCCIMNSSSYLTSGQYLLLPLKSPHNQTNIIIHHHYQQHHNEYQLIITFLGNESLGGAVCHPLWWSVLSILFWPSPLWWPVLLFHCHTLWWSVV